MFNREARAIILFALIVLPKIKKNSKQGQETLEGMTISHHIQVLLRPE